MSTAISRSGKIAALQHPSVKAIRVAIRDALSDEGRGVNVNKEIKHEGGLSPSEGSRRGSPNIQGQHGTARDGQHAFSPQPHPVMVRGDLDDTTGAEGTLQLSKQEAQQGRVIFDLMDQKRSGFVSVEELCLVEDCNRASLLRLLDCDHTNQVSPQNWGRYLLTKKQQQGEAKFQFFLSFLQEVVQKRRGQAPWGVPLQLEGGPTTATDTAQEWPYKRKDKLIERLSAYECLRDAERRSMSLNLDRAWQPLSLYQAGPVSTQEVLEPESRDSRGGTRAAGSQEKLEAERSAGSGVATRAALKRAGSTGVQVGEASASGQASQEAELMAARVARARQELREA